MAKLGKLPGIEIINALKGVIDFYVWMGIACARKWPRSPGYDRAPAVQAAWVPFTWAASNWKELSQEVRDAYAQLAAGTNMTPRDIFTKAFINGETLYLDEPLPGP